MNNLEGFKKAKKIQREFKPIYEDTPIIAIDSEKIHVKANLFYELVGRGLVKITSKKPTGKNKQTLVGETIEEVDEGTKVIALEDDGDR